MRTKNFLVLLCGVITVSFVVIIFGQHKPETIQSIVSSTHEHIRQFQDNLRDAETKSFVDDEKYLEELGFTENPRLFPVDVWKNTSLPIIVTSIKSGEESQAFGLINNVARVLPNNTLIIYNLGLGSYALKNLQNYCNSSRCQVIKFDFGKFPSHVGEFYLHAYRPIIIQEALSSSGAILYLEPHFRFAQHTTSHAITSLFNATIQNGGFLAWPMLHHIKNPVSSLTHRKMFEYFDTDAENFIFLPMISSEVVLVVNNRSVHEKIMLPWVQCSLTQDCILPIGAQSGGCKFDKKPLYRYSGCHHYDISALNIVLGLFFNFDSTLYTSNANFFTTVSLTKAITAMQEFELNYTSSEGRGIAGVSLSD